MYTDQQLKDHELSFWLNHWSPQWTEEVKKRNNNFVLPFFDNFKDAQSPILEVGSGGFPISQMLDIAVDVCDPIHDQLKQHPKFLHLNEIQGFSCSFLEMPESKKFNAIICLNCLDHFNDNEKFFEKASKLLNTGGRIYLFYHLRNSHRDDHLSINQKLIDAEIEKNFEISKFSDSRDPNVNDWADGARRYILIKK